MMKAVKKSGNVEPSQAEPVEATEAIKKPKKPKAPQKIAEVDEAPKKTIKKRVELDKIKLESSTEWIERISKDKHYAGKVQVQRASEVKNPFHIRRPTGILSLDIALGGGIPAGGQAEIFGGFSAGKTFLTYVACAEIQRIYGDDSNIYIWKTENRQEKDFARLAGFCIAYSDEEILQYDKLRVAKRQPSFTSLQIDDLKHQIGNVVVVATTTADYGFDLLVDAIENADFQIAIIDSLGVLQTKAAEEGDVGDKQYGGSSRDITTFENKLQPLYNLDRKDGTMRETTLIGINQLRASIGASKYEEKEHPAAGAWAWKHGQLLSLHLKRGAKIWAGKPGEGNAVGHAVRWEVKKGKAGTHDGKRGEFNYFHFPKMEPVFWKESQETFLGGIGLYEDMAETAKQLGVALLSGSWWSYEGLKDCQGIDKFAQQLADNQDIAKKLREHCLDVAGVQVQYR